MFVRAGEAVSRQCLKILWTPARFTTHRIRRVTFVNAAEVRETMNKSSQVCARVRDGEHPVSL